MEFRDDLVSPLRVACVIDPAIDRATTDVLEYMRTRDASLIRALPGQRVMWFNLRALTTTQYTDYVETASSVPQRYRRAFQCSVASIENIDPSGQPWMPTGIVRDEEIGGPIAVITERELPYLRKLGVGYRYWYELGHLACERAGLEGKIFGGDVHFTLPPTSLAELERIAFLLAEQSRTLPPIETSAPPASESPPLSAELSG
jgi:hypothetical protein